MGAALVVPDWVRASAEAALIARVGRWFDEVALVRGVGQLRRASQVVDWVHGACSYALELGFIDVATERNVAEAAYSRYQSIVVGRRRAADDEARAA